MKYSPAPDEWDFYPSKINNATAFVMVNFWFGDKVPIKEFPRLLWVFIEMEAPGPYGIGLTEEADKTGPLEDALYTHVQDTLKAHFVGRVRGEGSWQLYFYAKDAAGFKEVVDAFMPVYPDRKYHVGHKADRKWEVFNNVLWPDEERMAWIADGRVVASLEKNGDPLTESRQVDHWIYFASDVARVSFESDGKRWFLRRPKSRGSLGIARQC